MEQWLRRAPFTFLLLLCLALPRTLTAEAKDMSGLYSEQELQDWHYMLELQAQRNFAILLTEGLEQRHKPQAVGIQLEMPLQGRRKDLMEFYAHGKTVVVPVLPLKFLRDILLANVWLYNKGFDPRTIDWYVSMLKHKRASDFPGRRYPQPLPVLGLPNPDQLALTGGDDKETRKIFFGLFNVTSGFIMAHEIGHIVLGHTKRKHATLKEQLQEEIDADAFALRVLSRVQSEGHLMVQFFALTLPWAPMVTDFPSRAAYEEYLRTEADHPVTGDRIRAIGREASRNPRVFLPGNDQPTPDDIEAVRRTGANALRLGDLLDRDTYQRDLAEIGRYGTLDFLRPRRPGQ